MKESPYLEGQNLAIMRIKALPIFKRFDNKELKGLLRLSKIRRYKSREIIIVEGSDDKWIYFILSGSVQVEKEENIVATLKKCGDIFGEMGFLDDSRRSSTVRAIAETSCLAVDVSHLLRLKEEGHDSFHATIYKVFAEILAYRLRETTNKFVNLKKDYDRIKNITGVE